MALANLPRAVAAFLDALQKRDIPAILARFTGDAGVVDRGVEHSGNNIKRWTEGFLDEGFIICPINVARRDGKIVLAVGLRRESKGMPSTAIQLEWWFTVVERKISSLTIEAAKLPHLPAPVASYVLASNTFDLDAILATFAEDAVVNDQLREYRGKETIKAWAVRDLIGDHVTMYLVRAVQHYGNAIVTANVDGDYDKRGLPNPLAVTFYFSIHQDKIIQLIILRNESDL